MNDLTIEEIGKLLGLVRREIRAVDPWNNNDRDSEIKALRTLEEKLMYEYNTAPMAVA